MPSDHSYANMSECPVCPKIECCDPNPFTDFAAIDALGPTTYWNTEIYATAACPDDLSQTATGHIAANVYSSTVDQATADSMARDAAYQLAFSQLTCQHVATVTRCIDCSSVLPVNQVPAMISNTATSDTVTSGVASGNGMDTDWWRAFDRNVDRSGNINTYWTSGTNWDSHGGNGPYLQYAFATAKTITDYILTIHGDASGSFTEIQVTWTLQGSNDEVNWTNLDLNRTYDFSNITSDSQQFHFTNVTGYIYYRLTLSNALYHYGEFGGSGSTNHLSLLISDFQLSSVEVTQVCATATAYSIESDADALAKATAAALAQCICP